MGHYHRLTLMEREELSRMLASGYSLRATAEVLQRAPRDLSGGACPTTGDSAGPSATETTQAHDCAPTPSSGLGPAGAPLGAGKCHIKKKPRDPSCSPTHPDVGSAARYFKFYGTSIEPIGLPLRSSLMKTTGLRRIEAASCDPWLSAVLFLSPRRKRKTGRAGFISGSIGRSTKPKGSHKAAA